MKHISTAEELFPKVPLIKKKGKTIPFGYELSDRLGYLQPIPLELEILQKYIQFVIDKKYSLRKASVLIEKESGRKLNHVSLKVYVDKELGVKTPKKRGRPKKIGRPKGSKNKKLKQITTNRLVQTFKCINTTLSLLSEEKKNTLLVDLERRAELYEQIKEKEKEKIRKRQKELKLERQLTTLNGQASGYVYIISSPTYNNWIKIGMTQDVKKRLQGYNAAVPIKNFKSDYYREVDNKYRAEFQLLHLIYKAVGINRSGDEWLQITNKDEAIQIMKKYNNEKLTMKEYLILKGENYETH